MSFQLKSEKILAKAKEYVDSVPYPVSMRWLFYRLLQDGTYKNKGDYNNTFVPLLSRARKAFYAGWKPNTLIDETRQSLYRSGEFETPNEWFSAMAEKECSLDEWYSQPYYVEVWFEAMAMQSQFEHYIQLATLRPFKGDCSIAYKWKIAKALEYYADAYRKPIIILYFGDLDKKGLQIPQSALKDIQAWCKVDFKFLRIGLTTEQVIKYQVPENFDKPGDYQWEAIPDEAAKEIIQTAIDPYMDQNAILEIREDEQEATKLFQQKISNINF